MEWELKHFGLELYTSKFCKERSQTEIFNPATFGEGPEGPKVIKNGLLDERLKGPKNISTFTNFLGHITLAAPLIRPECKTDIWLILEEEWPKSRITCDSGGWSFYKDKDLVENPRDALIDVREIWGVLRKYGAREIRGNDFIQHNTLALPETMIIDILPVPSILARPPKFIDGKYIENDLTLKLFDIIRVNQRLKENIEHGAPKIICDDLTELLQYHITTYLDNRTLGIPPAVGIGGEPLNTIAQKLGKNMGDFFKDGYLDTKVDSSIKRIVRCINSGERVIHVHGGSMDELAVELTKQCALKKIFSNLIWDDVVTCYQINYAGECSKMNVDVLENDEFVPWDHYSEITKSTIIHAFKDSRIMNFKTPSIFPKILSNFRTSFPGEKEKIDYEISKGVYSIIEKQTLERNFPSIVIFDKDSISSVAVLEKAFDILENNDLNRLEVAIIIWQQWTGGHEKDRGVFAYTPSDNSERYILIALNQIKRMKEFENYLEKLITWENSKKFENELKRISYIMKCLTYPEIRRLIGQVIQAKGILNLDTLKEYTLSVLVEKVGGSHGEWKEVVQRHFRELKDEDYKVGVAIDEIQEERVKERKEKRKENEQKRAQKKKNEKTEVQTKNELTYEDIKGLDPLITWCKRKGRLFSKEAKEFGFDGYPKGLLLTGVPGCGKTMTAKVIANEWKMGFKRYQADDFVSSNVGGAEEKTRTILDDLDEMAPTICFVDEAEKIFGQTKATEFYRTPDASRDSVESMILQFMEENEKGVFFIFTANDYEKLSPALVDRFDERFFIDLPSKESREEIIKSTLTNSKQDFTKFKINKLSEISNEFTGRDIRSAINESMMIAFDNNRKLTEKDLISAFEITAPTSKIHKGTIDKMRNLVLEGKMRRANTHVLGKWEFKDDESFRAYE
jgi:SpoVK/Ycf46/Vps4 family AAA+-type ATPase